MTWKNLNAMTELLQPVEPETCYLCIIIDVILHYIIHALYKWFLCISIFCTTDEGSCITAKTFGFIFLFIGEENYNVKHNYF